MPAAGQNAPCDKVRALTQDPTTAAAHWGISVTTIEGTALCQINDAQLFRPASNAKLFTIAAALALLSPTRTFTTFTRADFKPGTVTLNGDLVLQGGGDAFLSERAMPYRKPGQRAADQAHVRNPLEDIADSIAASGLQHITGNIVGDDTLFPYEPLPGDWSVDDTIWGYGAPVSALTIDDNQMTLTVTPGPLAGSTGTVTLAPATPFYTVESTVTTSATKSQPEIAIERAPGSRILRVFGTVPLGAPYRQDVAIGDPAEFAALTLKALLEARGVMVDGQALSRHRPTTQSASFERQVNEPLPKLPRAPSGGQFTDVRCADECSRNAHHTSPTLLDDVTLTLKVSQNLHAELMLHQLGLAYGNDASTAQSCRVVRQFLLNAGIAKDDFFLNDGSGLSSHDLTTPRAITQLLTFAAAQPWFDAFKTALPVGGVDGSLSNRYAASTSPLAGKILAKTGTLGESRALSGYLTAASGRTLIFSILVDTHTPTTTADRSVMDRIAETIAAQN